MSDFEALIAIIGLTVLTVVTRGFFLLPERELPMPRWLQEGLRYAPLAALVAVVAPEVLMTNGQLVSTWRDARLFGAVVGVACFMWRRSLLGTIVAGTAVTVALRLGLGW